jgi:acyl carrier protein
MSQPVTPQLVPQPDSAPKCSIPPGSNAPDLPSSRESIANAVFHGLRAKFGGNPQPSDSLAAIGIDSLGMAEFSYEIEKRFGVRVDEDILNVETVTDLIDYIQSKAILAPKA